MKVALYGGTFDPVHKGHLAVAEAAAEAFNLDRIYFVPADIPPHRQSANIMPYHHRYAMLALALAGHKKFIPSILEAPEVIRAEGKLTGYSIDTVRRLKKRLKPSDTLSFIIGIDAFLDIAKWRSPVELLRECEFIVVSRPKFSLADVARALPEEVRPSENITKIFGKERATGQILYSEIEIHLLANVKVPVSATQVRAAAQARKPIARMVGPSVAEYISKLKLYRDDVEPGSPSIAYYQERDRVPAEPKTPPKSGARLQVVHSKKL
jgi:nicotinate-nucleotide adenylyltransferase